MNGDPVFVSLDHVFIKASGDVVFDRLHQKIKGACDE